MKDFWDSNYYVCDGWCYTSDEQGRTICLGKEEDVRKDTNREEKPSVEPPKKLQRHRRVNDSNRKE
jgi:hypothetical protein